MKIPVIIIFAPTATGKTALTINLFGKSSHSFFKDKAEIISADSMQVYKKLNIGTAKPSLEELAELPHHLVDICDITQEFSVADFVSSADLLCNQIYKKGKIPVIAGGTGFYIRNFILGLPITPESDEKIRNMLKTRLLEEGNKKLYEELKQVDLKSAEKIHINDSYRILRSLEVFYTTGKPRSSFELNNKLRDLYDFLILIPERNREDLYTRINTRVDLMFDLGLEKEVKDLINSGATSSMPGMKGIGYREWFCFNDINKIKEEIKRNSRKYAKKQYTYMSGIPESCIIPFNTDEELLSIVSNKIKVFIDNLS